MSSFPECRRFAKDGGGSDGTSGGGSNCESNGASSRESNNSSSGGSNGESNSASSGGRRRRRRHTTSPLGERKNQPLPMMSNLHDWPELMQKKASQVNALASDVRRGRDKGGSGDRQQQKFTVITPNKAAATPAPVSLVKTTSRSRKRNSFKATASSTDSRHHAEVPNPLEASSNPEKTKESAIFVEMLRSFDWRTAAAKYLFKAMTMEDYLAVYIDALASYRRVRSEPLVDLVNLLVRLSKSCPHEDILQIMPPNLSGLVNNQAAGYSKSPSPKKNSSSVITRTGSKFDVGAILARCPSLFSVDEENVVHYMRPEEDKESASKRIRNILVEGLFVYFFAKFCHGPTFEIKVPFYRHCEPIRSVLMLVTGDSDVASALLKYFDVNKEVFIFDHDTSILSLSIDYFNKDQRDFMKKFLKYDDQSFMSDNNCGSNMFLAAESLSCDGSHVPAASFLEKRSPFCCDSYLAAEEAEQLPASSSMPFAVRSVLDFLFVEEKKSSGCDSLKKTLTNSLAVDALIDKIEVLGHLALEGRTRMDFKQKLATLIQEFRQQT